MQLLLKLYTSVTYELENNIPEFEDSFIKTCIDGICQQLEIISDRTPEQKEELVRIEKQITAYTFTSI